MREIHYSEETSERITAIYGRGVLDGTLTKGTTAASVGEPVYVSPLLLFQLSNQRCRLYYCARQLWGLCHSVQQQQPASQRITLLYVVAERVRRRGRACCRRRCYCWARSPYSHQLNIS
jgi:hypothetical protein